MKPQTPCTIVGDHDEQTISQFYNTASVGPVFASALCADGHVGYAVPIGSSVAYLNAVSPSGVGFDIGCGNKAVLTDLVYADIAHKVGAIMDGVCRVISFGIGRNNKEDVDHELFDSELWKEKHMRPLKEMARNQLGTVGSGNHYVDIFKDRQDRIWVGVHFGSRGLGHKIATEFLDRAGGKDGMFVDPAILSLESPNGQEYWDAMNLAGQYAYAGRDWVCERVVRVISKDAKILHEVHNHHNFAWKENHFGVDCIVVRKGSTPLFNNQESFIGGTMCDKSYIIKGLNSEDSNNLLNSTVHGAGRAIGRRAATGKLNKTTGKYEGGRVTEEMMREVVQQSGIELRGAGMDESPHCYKKIDEVLRYHGTTLSTVEVLTPIGVAMAGKGEVDPYKD